MHPTLRVVLGLLVAVFFALAAWLVGLAREQGPILWGLALFAALIGGVLLATAVRGRLPTKLQLIIDALGGFTAS